MLQYIPNWLYPLHPPGWWPDRPREMYFLGLNDLPIAAGATDTVEVPLPKRVDTLVFGGAILVTLSNDVTILCPLSGPCSQILVRLRNPAGNINYTQSFNRSTPDTGFVPAENIFAVWQTPGQRLVYWPAPICVPRGGSLQMDVLNEAATNNNVRFTFLCGLVYDEDQREVA